MQFSLSSFDPDAKKMIFKVVINDGASKRILFREAFFETELKDEFPDANIFEVKRKIY